jgi:hypothetical protein
MKATTAPVRRKPRVRTQPVESVAGKDSYAAFMRRAVRAYVRRAGEGDLDALEGLVELEGLVAQAIRDAGAALHDGPHSYSWAEIAAPLGITRQAAAERFTPRKDAR